MLKSSPEYRDVTTTEAKNVKNVEPWRDSGLGEPWVHESGLEYRDVATIEAARSVARFARNNQYLGSFKTRQGEIMIRYFLDWESIQLKDSEPVNIIHNSFS